MSRVADAAIVGAGPQGLAVAAHMREAGLDVRVFGEVMEFWKRHMPAGMFLRSSPRASSISDPPGAHTLRDFTRVHHGDGAVPIPIAQFIAYGRWFQQEVVPDLDPRMVAMIDRGPDAFALTLDDGETLFARRVVIAAGIARFPSRPPQFDGIPSTLISHSVDLVDSCSFAGRSVAVVGGGQSAVESVALLHEAGADVEAIVRAPRIRWLREVPELRGSFEQRLWAIVYPATGVGPPPLNWLTAAPGAFKRLPRPIRDSIAYRCVRPAVATWLRGRVQGLRITTGRRIASVEPESRRVRIRLDDGTERRVDHVLLATGYRVDVTDYEFLSRRMLRMVVCGDGYPVLRAGLESSVPGLHFVGAAAAQSFGPIMGFVAGGAYAARAITRHVLDEPLKPVGKSR